MEITGYGESRSSVDESLQDIDDRAWRRTKLIVNGTVMALV